MALVPDDAPQKPACAGSLRAARFCAGAPAGQPTGPGAHRKNDLATSSFDGSREPTGPARTERPATLWGSPASCGTMPGTSLAPPACWMRVRDGALSPGCDQRAVPGRGRGKHETLKGPTAKSHYPDAKHDLANVFLGALRGTELSKTERASGRGPNRDAANWLF